MDHGQPTRDQDQHKPDCHMVSKPAHLSIYRCTCQPPQDPQVPTLRQVACPNCGMDYTTAGEIRAWKDEDDTALPQAPTLRATVVDLIGALKEAMRHVPEERRTHKRYIHVDPAAGSTYELDDAEWWKDAKESLNQAEACCSARNCASVFAVRMEIVTRRVS